jgi:hypothetical protein
MSKFINNNQKKPFCKVCFDAKKPESEYTSHYVRSRPDQNGNTIVTCPILSATECRYCYKFGHTIKFCNVLEEKKKKDNKDKSVAIRNQKAAERNAVVPVSLKRDNANYAGKFASLYDEEEEVKPIVAVANDDFPTLNKKEVNFEATSNSNWASVAAKPAAPVEKPVAKPATVQKAQARSWADESDSDDERVLNILPSQNEVGEDLYWQVIRFYPENEAGKITAVILESFEIDEVLSLIANPASMREIADEISQAIHEERCTAMSVSSSNIEVNSYPNRTLAEDNDW